MAELKFPMQTGRRSTSSLWLIATLLIIVTQSAVPVVGDSYCLRCEDFNRQKNKQLQCAKKYTDCGDCISGFIQDPEDSRLCFSLEILEESEDVTKVSGSEVYLPCKYNARVICTWTKDGKEVNIAQLYKWSNGDGTDDCSINIPSLSADDIGTWVCSNRADSNVNSIPSRSITVAITSQIIVHPKPMYNVSAGGSVTIECKFDQPVKCSWMKDGLPINPKPNYQFNQKETTTDCSLTISSFNLDNDQGSWTCLQPGSSHKEAIASRPAQIRGYKSPAGPKSAAYKASVTNEKEPIIYFGEHNVNRRRIEYVPGISVDSLLSVSCRVSSGAYMMSWLLHGESEHPGVTLEEDKGISVDQQLETEIMSRLESQQEVELTCLVEYPDKESHSTIVTFVNVASQSVQDASSLKTLFSVIIAIIGVMVCMVLAAIGLAIYLICLKKSRKSREMKENKSPP